jgi:ABC-type uncharacterized transport system ATPase subunit
VRLSHILKSFGGTRAVDDVSLDIRRGEILAVVGENGAGKTTLMRIAAGELTPDSGVVVHDEDAPVILSREGGEGPPPYGATIAAAKAAASPQGVLRSAQDDSGSVGLVHQHFLLVPELTIAENLAVTATAFRFLTRKTLEHDAQRTIEASGIELRNVARRVEELSVGEKAKLELIKAIARNPSTLILDEPTSVLTPYEAEELFRVMRGLAAKGTGIVFISHKLPEVLAVAQRIVVMRAGRLVMDTSDATAETLAAAMVPPNVGRASARRGDISFPSGEVAQPGTESPDAQDSSTSPGMTKRRVAFRHRDLTLHANEIVAIVGVAGNGQSELAAELRALLPRAAHIPEDRTRDGIVAEMTIAENLALRGVENAPLMIQLYSIRAHGASQRAGDLSGGNQQKLVLARELDARPEVIIAAEPTRGLDLDATAFVHDRLRAASAAGAAILLITSDLDEAFALADVIRVIYRGRLSEGMTGDEARPRVASLMAGLS